jgi:hypothetical protein
MSKWRADCQALIAKLTADLPADADWKAHKKVLWGRGYSAHLGTSWGKKMWSSEVRKHLAAVGGPATKHEVNYNTRLSFLEASGDIAFPFRKTQ